MDSKREPSQLFYSKLRAFEICQFIVLGCDILCNLMVDSASSNPVVVLIVFVLQCVLLLINLCLYVMSTLGHTLKYRTQGPIPDRGHCYICNFLTIISYMVLTIWWYIWTLTRLWPSVGDHFSFSTSFTLHGELARNDTIMFEDETKDEVFEELTRSKRERYTLWSSGFIALYVIQRTMAPIYYISYSKSVLMMANGNQEEVSTNQSKEPEPDVNHPRNPSVKTISELMQENKSELVRQYSQPFLYDRMKSLQESGASPATISNAYQHFRQQGRSSPAPAFRQSQSIRTPRTASVGSPNKDQHHSYQKLRFEEDYEQQPHRSSPVVPRVPRSTNRGLKGSGAGDASASVNADADERIVEMPNESVGTVIPIRKKNRRHH